jgi:acid stress chaperone HdeB
MRIVRVLAVSAALLSFVPSAQAQRLDLSKTTCKELIESGKDGLVIIWSWLYGYYSDQDADPVIDFDQLTKQGQRLVEVCKEKPSTDIITAAEPIYDK